MEREDEMRRARPLRAYQPGTTKLRIPRSALDVTVRLLKAADARESGLFWYGLRDRDGNGEVQYVVAPKQRMTRWNYAVDTASLTQIVNSLPDDWRPLAQIHSHPGKNVEHSRYDDEMASSRKSLSLVIPSYGHWHGTFPDGIGVHEWQVDYWHLLNPEHARNRLEITDGHVREDDFR